MAIRVTLEDQLKRNHVTSKELCEKVGITEANMSLLRRGSVKGIRFNTLNRICYYLHCNVEDILSFDGNLEVEDED